MPEDHGFSQVELQALEVEGANIQSRTITAVAGLWILNSHAVQTDANNSEIIRRTRLLEVGAEGDVRRSNLLRRENPQ
eukprot:2465569-Amphidinium_carterae.1